MEFDGANLPDELSYDKDSSWVKVENNTALVGVTQPKIKQAQELVFAELPEVGKKIRKGDVYITLESVKWSGHISSPVSGEILEVNDEIFDEPSKLNEDPYKNWVMKVKLDDARQTDELLNSEQLAEELKKR